MSSATGSTAPHVDSPPPYPTDADSTIRQVAGLFNYDQVIHLLDNIRTRILGNILSIERLAAEFSLNNTLSSANEDISKAVQVISGTWSGRAADQFNTYASRVQKSLDAEQQAVSGMSHVLSEIAETVVDAYAQALDIMGKCAGTLAKLGMKVIIAVVTEAVPIVDIFTSKDVLDTVIDALSTFVEEVSTQFNGAIEKIHSFVGEATELQQTDTNFTEIPDLPENSGMDNTKQWRLNPQAAPA